MFLGALTVLFTLGTAAYRSVVRVVDSSSIPRELAHDCRRTYWSLARAYA